jgi:UDP-2,4-diacetamido-2,4,6-trideoxy-beta-L-altropyranose hydrolase
LDTVQIIFRCEFGTQHGFGHLMRCISLGQAFQEYERIQTFCFSTSSADGFKDLFDCTKMTHTQLPKNALGLTFAPDRHFKLSDAFITVFDNYDVTEEQMITYKQNYPNLVAIDDLADRVFHVDMIINQNLGSDQLEYNTVNQPKLLLGAQYALLRKNILNARRKKESKRIFMSFGGGEVYDRIKGLLEILLVLDKNLTVNITVDFVIGGKKDNKEQILSFLSTCKKLKFNFIEDQMNLFPYMAKADFAVTAAGSTVFELACLGVPQIVLVIDKNQEITGQKINEIGLGTCLGDINETDSHSFEKTFFSFLHDDHMKQSISRQAQKLIDGKGAQRVADGILKHYGYN